ncbi:MAG: DUF1315 family protein [Proteobacteria bacterium]|jgi:uncharacterized protein YeaC (DUF1315 family)|nr:DUF1315 family protein [Pseudomonadota bacterium]
MTSESPDCYLETLRGMSREVYDAMLSALATGRWPDGRAVSPEQRAHTMQAVIAWGELHLAPEDRVGFIDKGKKSGEVCDEPQPISWQKES